MEHGRKWDGTPDYSMTLIEAEQRNTRQLDGDFYSNITPDKKSHFSESGVIEADCFICHMKGYKFGPRNQQINQKNYRWAATVGAGLGKVQGAIFSFKDPDAPPGSKDFMAGAWNFSDRPKVSYSWDNRNLFNRSGMLTGELVSKEVDTKNCLLCHAGPDAKKVGWKHMAEYDVHLKAGLRCTDCHSLVGETERERLQHQIAKGWHPLGSVRDDLDGIGMKTCSACHLEGLYKPTRAGMPEEAKDPTAEHEKKFPNVMFHMDMISCATCHSTQQPGMAGYVLDMAMGKQIWYNAATIESITWPDDFAKNAPKPWEPWISLFDARNYAGEQYIPTVPKVTQWFGEKIDTGEIRPIILKYVAKAFSSIQDKTMVEVRDVEGKAVKKPTVASEDHIKAMISALADMGFKNVVFVSDRIYELKHDTLSSYHDPFTAHPHIFPVHHNIVSIENRKTYGSEGKPEGCRDCHSKGSVFFTKMLINNPGRFLVEDYPAPREPNAEPQMYHWGFEEVPEPEGINEK